MPAHSPQGAPSAGRDARARAARVVHPVDLVRGLTRRRKRAAAATHAGSSHTNPLDTRLARASERSAQVRRELARIAAQFMFGAMYVAWALSLSLFVTHARSLLGSDGSALISATSFVAPLCGLALCAVVCGASRSAPLRGASVVLAAMHAALLVLPWSAAA